MTSSAARRFNVRRFAGYPWIGRRLDEFELCPGWIAIEEDLDRGSALLAIPRQQAAVLGRIAAIGSAAHAMGLRAGDRVVYEQWQGGRWSFVDDSRPGGEARLLIMRASSVLARVEED